MNSTTANSVPMPTKTFNGNRRQASTGSLTYVAVIGALCGITTLLILLVLCLLVYIKRFKKRNVTTSETSTGNTPENHQANLESRQRSTTQETLFDDDEDDLESIEKRPKPTVPINTPVKHRLRGGTQETHFGDSGEYLESVQKTDISKNHQPEFKPKQSLMSQETLSNDEDYIGSTQKRAENIFDTRIIDETPSKSVFEHSPPQDNSDVLYEEPSHRMADNTDPSMSMYANANDTNGTTYKEPLQSMYINTDRKGGKSNSKSDDSLGDNDEALYEEPSRLRPKYISPNDDTDVLYEAASNSVLKGTESDDDDDEKRQIV